MQFCGPAGKEQSNVYRTQRGNIKEVNRPGSTTEKTGDLGKVNSEKAQKTKFPDF